MQNTVVSVVDDDESVRVAAMRLLKLHGYTAHMFGTAEEFLDSAYVGRTGCLITDVRMPSMSGLALQEHLARAGHEIPIIFVTAYALEGTRSRAMRAGAICFLSKPFDGDVLMDAVERAMRTSGD